MFAGNHLFKNLFDGSFLWLFANRIVSGREKYIKNNMKYLRDYVVIDVKVISHSLGFFSLRLEN